MSYTSSYKSTYTTFSGADIKATFDGKTVGELQAISYSVTREKTPIYTMGSPDPRSFSRGKRGIAGSMVFTVFNKDALDVVKLSDAGKTNRQVTVAYANMKARPTYTDNGTTQEGSIQFLNPDTWETEMDSAASIAAGRVKSVDAYYADEIMPFDVVITLQNEYGQAAKFSLLGVEILNEGSGMSIDDISTEKACTFVARGISHLQAI